VDADVVWLFEGFEEVAELVTVDAGHVGEGVCEVGGD